MLFGAVLSISVMAATPGEASSSVALIPLPARMEIKSGQFVLNAETEVLYESGTPSNKAAAETFADLLRPATGLPLPVREGDGPTANTVFFGAIEYSEGMGDEGHRLWVFRYVRILVE